MVGEAADLDDSEDRLTGPFDDQFPLGRVGTLMCADQHPEPARIHELHAGHVDPHISAAGQGLECRGQIVAGVGIDLAGDRKATVGDAASVVAAVIPAHDHRSVICAIWIGQAGGDHVHDDVHCHLLLAATRRGLNRPVHSPAELIDAVINGLVAQLDDPVGECHEYGILGKRLHE